MSQTVTPGQHAALTVLAAGGSAAAAADAASVTVRTIRRWLTVPAFRASLDAARAQTMTDARQALTGRATRAVTVLAEVADDPNAPHAARVSAAHRLLSLALDAERDDLADRLTRLEELLDL